MTGKQLYKLRLLYGYSQREVAVKAHLSNMEISYIESGQRKLTEENEKAILEAMYLLNMEQAKKRADRQRRQAAKLAKMEGFEDGAE